MKELFNNNKGEFWSEKEIVKLTRKSLFNKIKLWLTKLYNTAKI